MRRGRFTGNLGPPTPAELKRVNANFMRPRAFHLPEAGRLPASPKPGQGVAHPAGREQCADRWPAQTPSPGRAIWCEHPAEVSTITVPYMPSILLSPSLLPILLLIGSNVFMTLAWYGHLRFKEARLIGVIVASWG